MPKAKTAANVATVTPLLSLKASAQPQQFDLMVYGDIGDSWCDDQSVSAVDVVGQLDALPLNTQQINVRINSIGGSVTDGLAIYNALKRHPANVVAVVEGVAMSVASLIAMAADEVQMPPTSVMMIHAPWGIASGNSAEMREYADTLDTFALAMAAAYAAKSGMSADDVVAQVLDGADHFYTGEQAVAAGFADTLITDVPDVETQDDPLFAAGLQRYIGKATKAVQKLSVAAAWHLPKAAANAIDLSPDAIANFTALIQAIKTDSPRSTSAATAAKPTGAISMPNTNQANQADPAVDTAAITAAATASAHAALRTRNTDIRAALEPYMAREGVAALYTAALEDPSASVDSVRAQALALLGSAAQPLGAHQGTVHGQDDSDKLREAGVNMLLARAGVIKGAEAEKARQGNPFARDTLMGVAEKMLIRAGVNTRDMSREDMARRVLASSGPQTTSDFQLLLENVLNKVIIGGYNTANFTWNRFCMTGTLSDYRPHGRYHLSSFSDLKPVNEAGEYENGVLGDGAKETITAIRKGRILEITPEVLINDDLGAFTRIAAALGQAAGRTIEKDVYALFALNNGFGPTMNDGLPLFDAGHHNIAPGAAPSVTAFDLIRQQMATQLDVGGNDYLDIMPAVFLAALSLNGAALTLNEALYDTSVSNKFQVPNIVRGMFRDIVTTPRLPPTKWYALADAAMEPVFEVAFLDGVSTPTLQQETNFRTDGLAWKVVHRYGVAAIGWRGGVMNPGQ
ncbi:ClpP-like prohead protease/major capsid protein fusion protein [Rhodanobacter sp. BL-MT-08]